MDEKKLIELADKMMSHLDIHEWAHDGSKHIASLFTVDMEAIRKDLLTFYQVGFTDGYKVGKGYKLDEEWGSELVPPDGK